MILNKCVFASLFHSFGVEVCHKSTVFKPFYAKYAKICTNYWKMSGFPSKNVRYPRYQDTDLLQLCWYYAKLKSTPTLAPALGGWK